MSRTTGSLHIRKFPRSRLVAIVTSLLEGEGLAPAPSKAASVRVVLRRDGDFWSVASTQWYSGFARSPTGDVGDWGKRISALTGRAVLTIWTWDGEASVVATRWKRGVAKAELTLLDQAFRGDDGIPRAPARVLWPWLDRRVRPRVLKEGIALLAPSAEVVTGDAELDALLAGFDDDEELEVEDSVDEAGEVFVSEDTSVCAIAAAIGMKDPLFDPWGERKGDVVLSFARKGAATAPARTRLELSEGTSNKFWEVWTEGPVLVVRFGRIGTEGQTKSKRLGSAEAAATERDKLIREKRRKGYA
jgi:predicted DNA-binding WGR domain protein